MSSSRRPLSVQECALIIRSDLESRPTNNGRGDDGSDDGEKESFQRMFIVHCEQWQRLIFKIL